MAKPNVRDKLQRLDDKFLNDIKDVQRARIASGKDDKMTGFKRLSLAIHNHPLFPKIKEDMKKAELPKINKRGSFGNILAIMAGIIIFIAAAFIIVLMGSVFVSNFGIITNTLVNIPSTNTTNVSDAAQTTFGNLNDSFGQFKWWAIMIIFGLAVGLLLSNFLVKIHPAFFIIYIFIVVIMIFVSIFISSSYQSLYDSSGTLGDTLKGFKGASWMVLYLPLWVIIISIIGGILLFINIGRDDSQARLI